MLLATMYSGCNKMKGDFVAILCVCENINIYIECITISFNISKYNTKQTTNRISVVILW